MTDPITPAFIYLSISFVAGLLSVLLGKCGTKPSILSRFLHKQRNAA